MIKKVKYGNFLSLKGNRVFVTNDRGQEWEFKRYGVSESYVRGYLSVMGEDDGIKSLIEKGNLIPIYGGEMNL